MFIINKFLKNRLYKNLVVCFLFNGKNVEEEMFMLDVFKKLNIDLVDIVEVEKLVSVIINLVLGKVIFNVVVVSIDNILKDLYFVI